MPSVKLFIIALVLFASCKKSQVATENSYVAFSATLRGANETPANASVATGTATATYNKSSRILKVNVTWSGVTATMAHIHKGAVGVMGAVVFPFTTLISPINFTSVALDDTQEADLLANLYYVNIHSAAYANGEIRGQMIKQ